MPTSQELAQSFLTHFNARERDELIALLDTDVRYNGRHGEGEGMHFLLEWIDRATTQMTPDRWFGGEDLSVVEIHITWHSPATGEITDKATWAMAFATNDGKITAISRYADVGEAVTKMGLLEVDTISEMGFPEVAEEAEAR